MLPLKGRWEIPAKIQLQIKDSWTAMEKKHRDTKKATAK